MHLNDTAGCAEMLKKLITINEHHTLIAFQISFDLEENATQDFLQKVLDQIPLANVVSVPSTPLDTSAMDVEVSPFLTPHL